MNHAELGRFLRTRREALRPADVGLTAGGRRRAPGLRRAEVAFLADVSVDYYERLERARAGRPSEKLLAGLADALRLTAAQRNYLYNLAGYPTSAQPDAAGRVEPELLFLLDSLTQVPAHVVDDLTNLLAQNSLSVALFGPWVQQTGRRANAIWRWFTEPAARIRNFLEDDPQTGRQYVAILRAASAARGHDAVVSDLISDLRAASAEFTRYWDDMEVEPIQSTDKTLTHASHGRFDVRCEATRSATTGQSLLVMRPRSGTGTAQRFRALEATFRPRLRSGSSGAAPDAAAALLPWSDVSSLPGT